MPSTNMPQFPVGAVYFRKSNPPAEDWAHDYQTASDDGMNIFRHWFLWGAIEIAPGVFDWADYDRQLELAEKHGIRTIIAEHLTAPEWIYQMCPDGYHIAADGRKIYGQMSASSVTGGGAVCLDNPDIRQRAEYFLSELAKRYKGHPGLLGYDISNEFHYTRDCFCENTMVRFREWLIKKHGTVEHIAKAWKRFSYTDVSQILPPRSLGPYPECLDWLDFRKDNFYETVQWKIDLIRSIDPDCLISGHGEASHLNNFTLCGSDEWRAAEKVELYGMTYVQERHGTEAWRQLHCADIVRAGSRGKAWWHSEFQGGHVWINPFGHTKLKNRARYDARMVKAENIRIWSFLSIAGGAKGILSPRWRSLLDGFLFGAYGFYANDGGRTERSRMMSSISKWANSPLTTGFFKSNPVKGQVGLVILPESLAFKTLLGQDLDTDVYDKAISGAYRAFHDNNIQADFVDIQNIDEYDLLFFAYPIMGYRAHFEKIKKWVENGGNLICQGCPAYFGDTGRIGTRQPNFDLGRFFGVDEQDVEFLPDISSDIKFVYQDLCVDGRTYLQSYIPRDAEVLAQYCDGRIAVTEKKVGSGKTMLIGTFPSSAYYEDASQQNKAFFKKLLEWGGKVQEIAVSDPSLHARLFDGEGGRYAVVLNKTGTEAKAEILFNGLSEVFCTELLWGNAPVCQGNCAQVRVDGKDVLIFKL